MKKTFLFLGLFILTLATAMTSCTKSNSENNNGSNNGSNNTKNTIIIGDEVYEINSAFYDNDDDDDIELIFTCNDLIFDIELDDYAQIPTGTFELTRDGRHTAEVDMLFHDYEYDVTGALTISQSEDVFTITITGDAYKDREVKKFSMTFQGKLNNDDNGGNGGNGGGGTSSDNAIIIGETTYPIESSLYYVEYDDDDEPEVNLHFIGGAVVDINLENLNDLVPGTYNLTDDGLYEGDVDTAIEDFDIIGEMIVAKNNEIFTITITGVAVEDDIQLPFSLNYVGEIFNLSENSGSGQLTLNNISREMNLGAYAFEPVSNLSVITLTNNIDSDLCSISFIFMGVSELPVGTYQLSQIPNNGAMAAIEFNDDEYMVTDGELTITTNGDLSYTITANGNAFLYDDKSTVPFSCTYEGRLIEIIED